jgi:ABC-type transporter Mla subunit MlaD
VAKSSRVPPVVGAIPVVGGIAKSADSQAQWVTELVEQNARLVGQIPNTMKTLNDSIETFNATVQRLDKVVGTIEQLTGQMVVPLDTFSKSLNTVPDLVDVLRREAVPALRAATDTQKQLALLTAAVERVLSLLGDLPGAGLVRKFAPGPPST